MVKAAARSAIKAASKAEAKAAVKVAEKAMAEAAVDGNGNRKAVQAPTLRSLFGLQHGLRSTTDNAKTVMEMPEMVRPTSRSATGRAGRSRCLNVQLVSPLGRALLNRCEKTKGGLGLPQLLL